MLNFFSRFKYFDIPLFIGMLLLLSYGLVVLFSNTIAVSGWGLISQQLISACLGLLVFFVLSQYEYHRLTKYQRYIYLGLVAILIFILFFGREIRGSSRWFELGPIRFQPAEFAKLITVIVLSRWFQLKRGAINNWWKIIGSLGLALIPAFLILREPDLGSAIIVMSIWFGMLLLSPIRKTYIATLLLAGVLVSGLAWQFFLHDYQRTRVEVFLNPDQGLNKEGYNVQQAQIAVGSGQWFGQGLGQGQQSQLRFLPERHTDFIFAATAEEVGFVGIVILIGLYVFIFWRLIRIMRTARDELGYYLCGGVFMLLLSQFTINIGMNIGLLPVTGIPLPFMSYGGNALIVMLASMGIVQRVALQSKVLRF